MCIRLDRILFLYIMVRVETEYSGGCRIVAIISAFQAEEGGSIPPTRSVKKVLLWENFLRWAGGIEPVAVS